MKATLLALRRYVGRIFETIEHNETVVLSKRGKEIAYILPKQKAKASLSLESNPAFGMWKDRSDTEDSVAYVSRLRNGHSRA
jgi:hypothetical protein